MEKRRNTRYLILSKLLRVTTPNSLVKIPVADVPYAGEIGN